MTPRFGREQLLSTLSGQLIVSCQAPSGHALRDTPTMTRLAQAAVAGGASAIRCGGVGGTADIAAIAAAVRVPVIGLTKDGTDGVYITPTLTAVEAVVRAGADIVAIDATDRPRPDGSTFIDTVRAVHGAGRLIMADISTLDEGITAAGAGADIIATTLSGYTATSSNRPHPDTELVATLHGALPTTIIVAEGRYHTPDQAVKALEAGATAVVVGTAITDTTWITNTFAQRLASIQHRVLGTPTRT